MKQSGNYNKVQNKKTLFDNKGLSQKTQLRRFQDIIKRNSTQTTKNAETTQNGLLSRDTENIQMFDNINLNKIPTNNVTTNAFTTDNTFEQQLTKKKGRTNSMRGQKKRIPLDSDESGSGSAGNINSLDSQMDDFMIHASKCSSVIGVEDSSCDSCSLQSQDVDSDESFNGKKGQGSHSDSHSVSDSQKEVQSDVEESDCDEEDIEAEIHLKLQQFYDTNYFKYEVNKIEDYINNQVWCTQLDESKDILYIFQAKYKILSKGEKKSNIQLDKILSMGSKKYTKELKALRVHSSYQVRLTLTFQIWNIDDRIIKDKDHRKRPWFKKKVLSVVDDITSSMNEFQIMQALRTKFHDYAQCVVHNNHVFFFNDINSIVSYDNESQKLDLDKVTLTNCVNLQNFRMELHIKGQVVEKFLLLNYYQIENETMSNNKMWQKLELTTVDFTNMKNNTVKHNKNYMITKDIDLNDEFILAYYKKFTCCKSNKKMNKMLIQRVQDQQNYIVLFPTGNLCMIGIYPFTIHSKIQLNLTQEESIMDYFYCVSNTGMNHCLWILDSKLQVWKCTGERDEFCAQQCNWNLEKKFTYSQIKIRKFFQNMTNFDEFYVIDDLSKIRALKNLGTKFFSEMEYLSEFNENATKAVIVQQPEILAKLNQETNQDSVKLFLGSVFTDPIHLIKQCSTRIVVLAKDQGIIMNKIFCNSIMKGQKKHSLQSSDEKYTNLPPLGIFYKMQIPNQEDFLEKQINEFQQNEICQMIHMGKIYFVKDSVSNKLIHYDEKLHWKIKEKKVYRQFLVRRKKFISILYTNGLQFWDEEISDTKACCSTQVSSMKVSNDFKKILVHIVKTSNLCCCNVKILHYNMQTHTYSIANNRYLEMDPKENAGKIILDRFGELFTLNIEIISSKTNSEISTDIIMCQVKKNFMSILIPKNILIDGLFQNSNNFGRSIVSGDGKLIMNGRIVIILNQKQNNVQDIGCYVWLKNQSVISYQFHSLFNEKDREKLQSFVKKPITMKQIVSFGSEHDNYPIFASHIKEIVYFAQPLDNNSTYGIGTSIVKLSTKNLQCVQIYHSKYNITNLQIYDWDRCIHQFVKDQKNVAESDSHNENLSQSAIANSIMDDSRTDFTQEQLIKGKLSINRRSNDSSLKKVDSLSEYSQLPLNIQTSDFMLRKQNSINKVENQKKNQQDILQKQKTLTKVLTKGISTTYIAKHHKIQKDKNTNMLTLVSQSRNNINIEIIQDDTYQQLNEMPEIQLNKTSQISTKISMKSTLVQSKNVDDERDKQQFQSKLVYFVSVYQRNDILVDSKIGWCTNEQLILTINNQYYLLDLNKRQMLLQNTNNNILYGKQHNAGFFVTIASSMDKKKEITSSALVDSFQLDVPVTTVDARIKLNLLIVKAQECLQKMDVANLSRYVFIKNAKQHMDYNKMMLFFAPCEELKGSSIFAKLSYNFNIIMPYVNQIDNEFISYLNSNICNINYFISFKRKTIWCSAEKGSVGQVHGHGHQIQQQQNTTLENQVHMYQNDMSGESAIDNAFKNNSIFCIKAFIDNLLEISNDNQFRNCFDKGLLLMVKKGMNVSDLCKSSLFYPTIWSNYKLFSEIQEPIIVPYSKDIQELDHADPALIFDKSINIKYAQTFDKNILSKAQKKFKKQKRKENSDTKASYEEDELVDNGSGVELHEMQYKYLNLQAISNKHNIEFSSVLSDTADLTIFDLEPIQMIIDFKWNQYGKWYYLQKFLVYAVFLLILQIDLDSLHKNRDKAWLYIIRKVICILIKLHNLKYEMVQMRQERCDYMFDPWNYIQILSIVLYLAGAAFDIFEDELSDLTKFLYVCTLIFTLINFLFLVRVFAELSFLVKMIFQVMNDVRYFLILFVLFTVIFAQCFQVLQVDISSYGRVPSILCHFINVLRISYGDFSLIDVNEGFDLTDDEGEYRHSAFIVILTFVVFIVSSLAVCMILMNFIIAVISDSYFKITRNSIAHDYKAKIVLINEIERFFTVNEYTNQLYFPNILIIRQRKQGDLQATNDHQVQLKQIKKQIKEMKDLIHSNSGEFREVKDHIKNLMMQVTTINQNITDKKSATNNQFQQDVHNKISTEIKKKMGYNRTNSLKSYVSNKKEDLNPGQEMRIEDFLEVNHSLTDTNNSQDLRRPRTTKLQTKKLNIPKSPDKNRSSSSKSPILTGVAANLNPSVTNEEQMNRILEMNIRQQEGLQMSIQNMNNQCSFLNNKNHSLEQQNAKIHNQMQEMMRENMEMKYQLGIASNNLDQNSQDFNGRSFPQYQAYASRSQENVVRSIGSTPINKVQHNQWTGQMQQQSVRQQEVHILTEVDELIKDIDSKTFEQRSRSTMSRIKAEDPMKQSKKIINMQMNRLNTRNKALWSADINQRSHSQE